MASRAALPDGQKQNLLAIETSTVCGSVAVALGETVLATSSWHRERSHGELVTARIELCLNWAGIAPNDIQHIVVDVGPGSFTGIRVGVNVAKSMAYATGAKVLEENSLKTLVSCLSLATNQAVVALIDAHDGHFFAARFEGGTDSWKLASKITAVPYEEIEKYLHKTSLFISESPEKVLEFVGAKARKKCKPVFRVPQFPSATTLAQIAFRKIHRGKTLDWKSVTPLYIRASGAEEKLARKSRT